MFNLIKRDVILQKRLLLTFIPFILFFIIADSHPALIFLVASIFIPFNGYYYDKQVATNILLNSLPYTRTEIIASRYLGAIIYMTLAIGVTSLVLLISNKPFTLTDIAIASGLFLVFAALTFPLFYIFNSAHIFTVVLISFLLLAGIGPPIVSFLAEHLTTPTDFIIRLPGSALYTGATVIILTLYIVSWGISTIIYRRKAF